MAIALELSVNGTADANARYVGWTPAPCALRVLDADGAAAPIAVVLDNRTGAGGKLAYRLERKDPAADTLRLDLPVDGSPVGFFVAGRFGAPSSADGDAPLRVRPAVGNGPALASFPMMVRIRKNADQLTTAERDRLLSALARLNNQGIGAFQSFRDTHLDSTRREAHGRHGFLPWHRAYVLDLERELQKLDRSVALPYWRFDRPARRLFTANYLGAPDASGVARFAASNPLRLWTTDGQLGIARTLLFNPQVSGAHDDNGQAVLTETQTVQIASAFGLLTGPLEGNPHGAAHTSFTGWVSAIDTAAKDPLFFLLHANVDRLWAKWQWFRKRFDTQSVLTYQFQGAANTPGAERIGHNLLDSMWPWNNVRVAPRPQTAPRTPFPATLVTPAPAATPTVRSMIDFQGHGDVVDRLGFDYDDVPYEPQT